ncbi:MAG TPA: gliding motility-associated C-terminal domain-containing protein, partial [Flavisolibacter sp.]|nr:gliding motility-associated C-terminal domain-containing protein [Flavisolibacter sp.]
IDSNFQNLAAGSYVVKIKDATGCVDSISLSLVQLYPDLVFTDQVTSASCNGSNGKIELTASGGSFPYTYSAGGVSYGPANILTVNSGTTTVFVKDANGCMASKPVTVTADPPITLSVLPSPEVCDGSAQGYVYLQAAGGSTDYEYSIDGINFQDADSFLVTNNSLTAQVRDEKGCSASLPFTVSLGQPVFVNAGNDTTICEGTSLNFDATGNASSYTWTPHPSLSAFNIAAPVASPVQPTTYFVKVTQGICVAEDSVRVDVWKAPVANAGPDSSICYGRTIQLTGSGGTTYSWLPSGAVDDPSSPLPSIRPGRNTDYYLRVKDANGCASLRYDTVRIGVVPALQVFAGRDTAVAIGQPFQLSAIDRSNSGATVFEWSPAIGLSDPGIANPAATLDRDISYTITMKTAEGCEGSDQISIRVFKSPEIFVPSGFTPDEDGRNDVLRAIPVGMKTFLYFKVYNRWGQQVFSTANEGRGWDGRINGVKQLTGTYVWVAEAIDYNGNRVTRRGSVTLIR